MFDKIFNKKVNPIKKMLNDFTPIFIKNVIDNNIIRVIESDLPSDEKAKTCSELLELCSTLLFGKKTQKYQPMIFGVNKFSNLERYISYISKNVK